MRNLSLLFIIVFIFCININSLFPRILYVGPGQQYSTIQSAINVAVTNDTIKVLPGIYNERITINKNIVLLGSGYETTRIISSQTPTVTISSGKLMWFYISSTGGTGVDCSGGIISNCVIAGCSGVGVYFTDNSQGQLINSILYGNGDYGALGASTDGIAINTISANNGGYWYSGFYSLYSVTYCCTDKDINASNTTGSLTRTNPQFVSSSDFHLKASSPCINSGNPVILDPDGTRSDMGYFGGAGCPIYPVITEIKIIPQGSGQVRIQAKAQANY